MMQYYSITSRFQPGRIDSQVASYLQKLDALGKIQYDKHPLEELRSMIELFNQTYRLAKKADAVQKIHDTFVDTIPVRLYIPYGIGPFPVFLYLHGGGWVFGSLDSSHNLCCNLSNRSQCIVCSVAYRLAPEHKYPAAIQDAKRVFAWLQEYAETFQGDSKRIVIGGDSAGGNLAAAITHQLTQEKKPGIAANFLLYPLLDASSQQTTSYKQYQEGYAITKSDLSWFIKQYVIQESQVFLPEVSPLLNKDLSNMPQTVLATAEFDPLRDEAEEYAYSLLQAGVPTTCIRYNGLIHGFALSDGIIDKVDGIITELSSILKQMLSSHK